jgi:hypothetical protein
MDVLIQAYPDFLSGHEGNELVWKDGTRMSFNDRKSAKIFETLLDAPSFADMFYVPYPHPHGCLDVLSSTALLMMPVIEVSFSTGAHCHSLAKASC